MTLDTVGQFLEQWWFLIAALGGFFGTLIKLYFKVDAMKVEIGTLRNQLKEHDEADKLMESRLTGLIDRNKETTETSTKHVQDKLEHIGNSITRLETLAELIKDKILK